MIITSYSDNSFLIDGVVTPKIYNAMAFDGMRLLIKNLYTDESLREPIDYSDVIIDGINFSTLVETINEINKITYV